MKVTQEILTVLADPAAFEVNVVMSGLRVMLTAAEAALLANMLRNGLELLKPQELAAAPATERSNTGYIAAMLRDDPPGPNRRDDAADLEPVITAASEEAREKTRALIRARIRDKGLSLWKGHRT
jgi:hypothetical protein